VAIPENVRDGDAFRVDGVASIPEENVRGDIEFVVRIRDGRFRLDGDDIVTTATMDIWQAARGALIGIPLPGGGSVKLTVPPGTADGRKFTSKGKGMPSADGGDPGHFVVVASIRPISVSTPAIDQALAALEQAVNASRQSR
jgi:curved DNA-binding protein